MQRAETPMKIAIPPHLHLDIKDYLVATSQITLSNPQCSHLQLWTKVFEGIHGILSIAAIWREAQQKSMKKQWV